MSNQTGQKVVAAVPDLFFAAKIGETAKQAGITVEFVRSEDELLSKAQDSASLIIVDLNAQGIDAVSTISKLKSGREAEAAQLIGFVRHEMSDLIAAARRAGCDQVLSRNAFSKHLPQILRGQQFQENGSNANC